MGFFYISCCRPRLYNIFICRTAVLEIRNVALLHGCHLKFEMLSSICSAMFLFLFHLLPAPFKDTLFPDFVGSPLPPVSLQSRWFEAVARCPGVSVLVAARGC